MVFQLVSVPPSQRELTKYCADCLAAAAIASCAWRLVPTNRMRPPLAAVSLTAWSARCSIGTVWARSEERRVGKECRSRCDWSSDVCSSDLVLRLALGADEQDAAAFGGGVADSLERTMQHRHGLGEVDDVNVVAGAEDVLTHLRVPTVGLVAEVHASFQKLTHGEVRK